MKSQGGWRLLFGRLGQLTSQLTSLLDLNEKDVRRFRPCHSRKGGEWYAVPENSVGEQCMHLCNIYSHKRVSRTGTERWSCNGLIDPWVSIEQLFPGPE